MNTKPILFSGPMVRALLDGRKTQTRRVLKPQPPERSYLHRYYGENAPRPELAHSFGWFVSEAGDLWPCNENERLRCPYGRPGGLLWVRETCHAEETPSGLDGVRFPADGTFQPIPNTADAADDWTALNSYRGQRGAKVPSIHMPRWASRLTLRITKVRVERLQDISCPDADAEGVPTIHEDPHFSMADLDFPSIEVARFSRLWDSINAAKGYGWDGNHWVWALTFEVIPANVDDVLRKAA